MANTQNIRDKWLKCLDIIKDNLPAEQFNVWLKPIVPLSFVDSKLTLEVPSEYHAETIDERYGMLLHSTLSRVFGASVLVYYSYKVADTEIKTEEQPKSILTNPVQRQSQGPSYPFDTASYADIDPQLNPKYTFENYCDSMSNKLAVSIGKAIADDPKCKTFNPLFVFGPTGVGKTHLIQAIGIRYKERIPRSRVLYVSARVFESQYTTAVRNNKVNDFINFYQSIDLLILDDVQEFAGKTGTQNTFYHIFNYLQQKQKQIIMSSDCRPCDMDGMEPRLLSRFKWGMTVELGKPDYDLRRRVLALKASQDGLLIPSEVLDYIAGNVTNSIRELEGIVVSLLAHATMLNQDLTIDLAQAVISNAVKTSKRELTFEIIAETVANHYNIDSDLLFGKSRKREISDARQLVMYLAKNETKLSSTNIGLRLSRNHATVLHACKQIEQRLSIEKKFKADVDSILAELKQ